jgi:protein phosphatase
VDNDTGLAVTDLTPAARTRVHGGITAHNRTDADRILTALREQRLPVCPVPGDISPGGPGAVTAPRPSPAGTTARPTTGAPARTAGPVPSRAVTRTSTSTTQSLQPGVDCREVK